MKYLNSLVKRLIGRSTFVAFLSVMISTIAVTEPQAATTEWHETLGGKLRLISGGKVGDRYKAGLEIVLDEGWKTYWKVPGDSGIPPMLDGSRSENVAKMEIRWPVPTRIAVGSSDILGYKEAIVFPLIITPQNPARPIALHINAQIGLCSDLCVPLSADLNLPIVKGENKDLVSEMLIDRDLALVPVMANPDFGVVSYKHKKIEGQPDQLIILTKIPKGYGKRDLFVEGPESWLLPLSKALTVDDSVEQKFELILDGLPKDGQSKGVELVFTLTNGEEAVAQSIILKK